MKEKVEDLNINEEYEKLVPPTKRESIFEESEDYESFRQYIIEQPRAVFFKKSLPFSEVKVTSYVEYKKQDAIDKEKGKHIFYLKQSRKGRTDFCDAAGYYIKQTRGFVVLPFSHIINEAHGFVPKGYCRKGKLDGANLYILTSLVFNSPEDAASFVLGQSAGMDEWIDARGKGLLAYYKELAEPKSQLILNLFDDNEEKQELTQQTLQLPQENHIVLGRSANGWEEWIDKDGRTLKEVFNGSSMEEAKNKRIAEVVAILQTPISEVLAILESGKNTIMGVLYELS